MAEHTKTPWRLGSTGKIVLGPLGCRVASVTEREEAYANARRIVACVNLCEGTATEYLEGANLGRLIRDGAELLACLKALLADASPESAARSAEMIARAEGRS